MQIIIDLYKKWFHISVYLIFYYTFVFNCLIFFKSIFSYYFSQYQFHIVYITEHNLALILITLFITFDIGINYYRKHTIINGVWCDEIYIYFTLVNLIILNKMKLLTNNDFRLFLLKNNRINIISTYLICFTDYNLDERYLTYKSLKLAIIFNRIQLFYELIRICIKHDDIFILKYCNEIEREFIRKNIDSSNKCFIEKFDYLHFSKHFFKNSSCCYIKLIYNKLNNNNINIFLKYFLKYAWSVNLHLVIPILDKFKIKLKNDKMLMRMICTVWYTKINYNIFASIDKYFENVNYNKLAYTIIKYTQFSSFNIIKNKVTEFDKIIKIFALRNDYLFVEKLIYKNTNVSKIPNQSKKIIEIKENYYKQILILLQLKTKKYVNYDKRINQYIITFV